MTEKEDLALSRLTSTDELYYYYSMLNKRKTPLNKRLKWITKKPFLPWTAAAAAIRAALDLRDGISPNFSTDFKFQAMYSFGHVASYCLTWLHH